MHNYAMEGNFRFLTSQRQCSSSSTLTFRSHRSHGNHTCQRACLYKRVAPSMSRFPHGGRLRRQKPLPLFNKEYPSCSTVNMPGSIQREPLKRGARIEICVSSFLETPGNMQRLFLASTMPSAILTHNE